MFVINNFLKILCKTYVCESETAYFPIPSINNNLRKLKIKIKIKIKIN